MSINIKDKIAIVTGASRGIGEGIAKIFANEPVDVDEPLAFPRNAIILSPLI